MHLTMPINRAKQIISLAINHHIRGDLSEQKMGELKSLSLMQFLEANLVLKRLNKKTDEKRKASRAKRHSWKTYITFEDCSLSEFFYSLHGGLTFGDVEMCMSNINDALQDIDHHQLNLVIDGDRSWFENEYNEMKHENEFYHTRNELMQALNNEFETAEKIYDKQEAA